ncbi:hypothetical protein ACIPIN_00695 [Pseudomonas sp. NPDC087697]|uniref:hypothetical protein n=1 Tax=Pseudomonas sp. NPDC087697 TaxID=3364447 RepID=UPI0038303B6E
MPTKKSKTSSFTNRGQIFGNAWSVFSYKTNSHYRITSDIELAHWLLFLEFDPRVKTFDLYPTPRLILDPRPHQLQLNAEVALRDGSLEWHKVASLDILEHNTSINTLKEFAKQNGVQFCTFTIEQIIPLKYKIMPLMRVAACLSAAKNIVLPFNLSEEMHVYVRTHREGCLGDILKTFGNYGGSVTCYLFAKMYADAFITVELNPHFFADETRWELI